MNNAPQVRHNGNRDFNYLYKNYTNRTLDLETAILVGSHSESEVKLMFFLTHHREGYAIPKESVMKYAGISSSTYKRVKKSLSEKGWLEFKENDYIKINYENIVLNNPEYRAILEEKQVQLDLVEDKGQSDLGTEVVQSELEEPVGQTEPVADKGQTEPEENEVQSDPVFNGGQNEPDAPVGQDEPEKPQWMLEEKWITLTLEEKIKATERFNF